MKNKAILKDGLPSLFDRNTSSQNYVVYAGLYPRFFFLVVYSLIHVCYHEHGRGHVSRPKSQMQKNDRVVAVAGRG